MSAHKKISILMEFDDRPELDGMECFHCKQPMHHGTVKYRERNFCRPECALHNGGFPLSKFRPTFKKGSESPEEVRRGLSGLHGETTTSETMGGIPEHGKPRRVSAASRQTGIWDGDSGRPESEPSSPEAEDSGVGVPSLQ